jgi:3-dehydroquinate synthase
MEAVKVNLGPKSYTIAIAAGLVDQVGPRLRALLPQSETAVIITDSHVGPLYAKRLARSLSQAGFQTATLTFTAGEQSKNLTTLTELYTGLAKAGVTRSDVVVALGGGVTGDMAGLAAATFLRGVAFVQVPTSLLAMVDSSVGGKVAVDLPAGKNLVGAFYQPKAVYIDTAVLKTLPVRYFNDGMAEVIKYGCIKDAALFDKLERLEEADREAALPGVIATCCNIKARIVEADEFDTGERMVLNFGHTLGHAVEKTYHYAKYSHGEAVGIGMLAFTRAAEAKGQAAKGTAARLEQILQKYHLPLTAAVTRDEFLAAVQMDKKKKGHQLTIVLLRQIGESFLQKIDFQDIAAYL